jgi:hypothetical protein
MDKSNHTGRLLWIVTAVIILSLQILALLLPKDASAWSQDPCRNYPGCKYSALPPPVNNRYIKISEGWCVCGSSKQEASEHKHQDVLRKSNELSDTSSIQSMGELGFRINSLKELAASAANDDQAQLAIQFGLNNLYRFKEIKEALDSQKDPKFDYDETEGRLKMKIVK